MRGAWIWRSGHKSKSLPCWLFLLVLQQHLFCSCYFFFTELLSALGYSLKVSSEPDIAPSQCVNTHWMDQGGVNRLSESTCWEHYRWKPHDINSYPDFPSTTLHPSPARCEVWKKHRKKCLPLSSVCFCHSFTSLWIIPLSAAFKE